MAKKLKKYQKGTEVSKFRPKSTTTYQVVDDNTIGGRNGYTIKERPQPISQDSLAKEIAADNFRRNPDPGFRPKFKADPNAPKPVRLRGKDDDGYDKFPPIPKNFLEPKKKGGSITSMNQVQKMYSNKKKK